jgi:hypothetical protein
MDMDTDGESIPGMVRLTRERRKPSPRALASMEADDVPVDEQQVSNKRPCTSCRKSKVRVAGSGADQGLVRRLDPWGGEKISGWEHSRYLPLVNVVRHQVRCDRGVPCGR